MSVTPDAQPVRGRPKYSSSVAMHTTWPARLYVVEVARPRPLIALGEN